MASSFQNIIRWMKNIDANAPDDVIRILVGNKSDLHARIVISTQDGQRLADKFRVDFFETSAKLETNQNISNIFYSLAEKILQQRQPIKPQGITVHTQNNQAESKYESLIGCCTATSPINVK